MKILEKLSHKQEDLYSDSAATVVFFGDSVTQGCFECFVNADGNIDTVFDTQNSYSQKFARLIRTLYPRAQLNIVDSGISGDNTGNALQRIDRAVLHYRPDLTVVCFGLNDCTRGMDGLGAYAENLSGIFAKIGEGGGECIFMTPNMLNTYVSHYLAESFSALGKNLSRLQTEGVMDAYMQAGKEAAEKNGVKICDCYGRWKKMNGKGVDTTGLLANYLNHPTRDMHWLFAWSLAETLFED